MNVTRTSTGVTVRAKPVSTLDYLSEETYAQTRAPVELATTVIPQAYTCPDFYAIEQERVFATSWIAVGCTSQLQESGQALVVTVAGRSLIVARDKAGRLRAFHNVCRHRGARLLDEGCQTLRSARIRCPYHSWTYDLTGACLGTPLFDGSDIPTEQQGAFDMSGVTQFDRADYGLIPAAAESWGGLIFVNLSPEAPALSTQLGDLPARLASYRLDEWRLVRATSYQVAANYKLVGENFMECYHLPWVHPELVKVSRLEDHYRWQGRGLYTGMCTTPIAQNTGAGGWQGLPPLRTLRGADAVSGRFAWLFPNTAISILPNHAFIILARPDGPDRTHEETLILTHPECLESPDADEELDQLATFWDLVNQQDIAIIERVQDGLSDPAYHGGRLCYHFEEPLHRFQNMIIDKMVGIERVPPGDEQDMVPMFGAHRSHAEAEKDRSVR